MTLFGQGSSLGLGLMGCSRGDSSTADRRAQSRGGTAGAPVPSRRPEIAARLRATLGRTQVAVSRLATEAIAYGGRFVSIAS
jgi:hypothetical protein